MMHLNNNVTFTFEYQGSQYTFSVPKVNSMCYINGNFNELWWTDGNGCCDCNRSQFIRDYCKEARDFKLLQCGDNIKLMEIRGITE